MDSSQRYAIWIIATGVVGFMLYFLREPLTQFAMAVILWLSIDGFANTLRRHLPFMPKLLALPIAIVLVLGLVALIGWVVISNVSAMAASSSNYQARIDQMLSQAYSALHMSGPPPTLTSLIQRIDPAKVAGSIGTGLQNFASDVIFVLIYLGFLFPATRVMSRKLSFIFGRGEERERVAEVAQSIRQSMETYLWVQTVLSLIITALTYVTLRIIGLDNALFWSFVIFFLNYIPTIGSVAAVLVTGLAALVQFTSFTPVFAVVLGVTLWQFGVGNFLQPRMTGESLNLSAVIVLLALAIWGAIWGIAGAFLAAPLTVMMMIVLAQFPSTRWIAIILSADGKPSPRTHVSE
jgi:AI-2 transport protein TqsA